ncbi:RAC-beta serine/threonine-protein kinase B-like [Copidosoma floridanum]|uniref:RAC-beta serine/threonine-protein kinase B-like n=1 Tax=Copidosoma floridanum TaxID=29053 RepID=UPI0006C979C4|nr:RAC-beta serine/threonine-protein kinase B-like [Copidosoma floridanum]
MVIKISYNQHIRERNSFSNEKPDSDLPRDIEKGWLQQRREHIKNWRLRYFILLNDGTWFGYKEKPGNQTAIRIQPSNKFTVKGCKIIPLNEPKPYTFVIRGLLWTRVIERIFYVNTQKERRDWIAAIRYIADKLAYQDRNIVQQQLPQIQTESVPRRSNPSRVASTSRNSLDKLSSSLEKTSISTSSKQKKVTLENFEFLKVLGRGGYGRVISCREKGTTENLYALKSVMKSFIIGRNQVSHTLSENRVMRIMRHPFLISLKYSFQTADRLFFVVDYLSGGDLYFHVKHDRFFDEDRAKFYGAEIILAVGYLHTQGIIHRDLKLENILLDKDGHIKIVDFGLCKEDITYGKTTNTFCGTPEYLAPEILEDRAYGRAVDWWSVGVIICEMMSGKLPFDDRDREILSRMIRKEKVKFPKTFSVEAKDVLRGLLVKDPDMRLGGGPLDAKEVTEHSFFWSINWNMMLKKKIPPPFKPQVTSDTDTRYFDIEFTDESVKLTPTDPNSHCLKLMTEEHKHFTHFSYQNISPSSAASNYHF